MGTDELLNALKQTADQAPLMMVWLDPAVARDHPLNYRKHSAIQLDALDQLIFNKIDGVGWAKPCLINDRRVADGWDPADARPTMLNGHARKRIAGARGEPIPALVGHWSPAIEVLILATLDTSEGQAERDDGRLEILTAEIKTQNQALKRILVIDDGDQIARPKTRFLRFGTWLAPLTLDEFAQLDSRMVDFLADFGRTNGFVEHLMNLAPASAPADEDIPFGI